MIPFKGENDENNNSNDASNEKNENNETNEENNDFVTKMKISFYNNLIIYK